MSSAQVGITGRFITCLLLCLLLVCNGAIAAPATATKSKSSATKKTETKTSSKTTAKKPEEPAKKKPATSSSDQEDAEEEKPSKPEKPAEPTTHTLATIAPALNAVVRSASSSGRWGVKVVSQQTGQTIFESNGDQGFIPASNRKLFTGALALDQLGPEFRFRTFLYRTGKVDAQGALKGNLVVKPSGDPTFSLTMYRGEHSDWAFRDWAQKVAAAGIKRVDGDLLIDCSEWAMNDLTPKGWPTRVLQDNYAPQTSPLTLNENLFTVIVNPGPKDTPGLITFAPPATGYPVVNNTVSGKKGGVSVKRIPGGQITVNGGVTKAGSGAQLPCDNPTLFAAANLRHHLHALNIPINGSIRIITSKGAVPTWTNDTLLAAVESQPLLEILKYMMKRSDNHMAEQVYVAISAAKLGRGGYSQTRRLEDTLLQKAGINTNTHQGYDGCGLSEANRVSASDVCKLLVFMLNHPQAQQYFDTMAISGRDGTLRGRLNTASLIERVRGKTGTINSVKCLSGYFIISQNQTLAFSILGNSLRGGSPRGTQDRICTLLSTLVL